MQIEGAKPWGYGRGRAKEITPLNLASVLIQLRLSSNFARECRANQDSHPRTDSHLEEEACSRTFKSVFHKYRKIILTIVYQCVVIWMRP